MKQNLKTREELEDEGYHYGGAAKCRGCGADIFWFEAPKKKRMPFHRIRFGSAWKLELHWAICPQAKEFRKPGLGPSKKKK